MTTMNRATEEGIRLHEDGFVTFRLADQWLGIPVVLIQEVLTAQAVRTVPRSPKEVSGFLNLRGQIVTAVDLRTRLGLPAREQGQEMNVVVKDGAVYIKFNATENGGLYKHSFNLQVDEPTTADLNTLVQSVVKDTFNV